MKAVENSCRTGNRTLEFILNGKPQTAVLEDGASLMELLREQFGFISPKNGCAPQGQCGCCTVIVGDKAVASCAVPAKSIVGKHVLTLEGLSERERDVFAKAFVIAGGLQCGFCIPGIVMRAKHLLSHKRNSTREEIAQALNNHICRCTGYVKILDAIQLAAEVLQGGTFPQIDTSGKVGTSLPRYDGEKFVLGERPYIDDMRFPGMLYGALLFSPHPRMKVLKIDTSEAEELEGVAAVVIAKDVPGERHQGLIFQDWPLFIAEGEETRYIGDVLAAVAAVDRKTARKAVELIRLEYEVLKPVTSPEEALHPDSPKIHPDGNLLSTSVINRGDVKEALKDSTFVATQTFTTQMVEHAFLEPESCIALPSQGSSGVQFQTNNDGWTLQVYSQGQGVFDDRKQIASFLGLPEERVHVTLVSNGGAFGGKEDMSIQGQTALLAMVTQRPVKITLTREESIRLHPKRHPMKLTYTAGCDAEGHLTAVKARIVGDTGAYASVGSKVLERAAGHATGPYKVPNVDVESIAAYTNNPPCGAMRGFGANQAAFAIEGMMDILAERVGIDGWEMRWRNVVDVGDTFCTGQVLEKSVGIKKTLLAVKDIYYREKYTGIACGIKNVGIGNGVPEYGHALITVEPDTSITIHTGFTEMGQGLFTVLTQFFSEVTGLEPKRVRVAVDTKHPTPCGMTTASRATVLAGRAVQIAAGKLKKDLDEGKTLHDLIGKEYFGEFVIDYTTPLEAKTDKPITHLTFGFATQVVILDERGRLKKVVAAHDVGKVINRKQLEGQIEGAIHMGLGYALTEELKLKAGVPEKFTMRSLGILRAKDMPEIEVIFIEENEPEGPFGAKGVGEIGLVPTAPAVGSALYKFDGIRRTSLPMKDSPAARAILGLMK